MLTHICFNEKDCVYHASNYFLLYSTVCKVRAAMPPPSDIVKVAIEWPGANAQLIEMDQVCVS